MPRKQVLHPLARQASRKARGSQLGQTSRRRWRLSRVVLVVAGIATGWWALSKGAEDLVRASRAGQLQELSSALLSLGELGLPPVPVDARWRKVEVRCEFLSCVGDLEFELGEASADKWLAKLPGPVRSSREAAPLHVRLSGQRISVSFIVDRDACPMCAGGASLRPRVAQPTAAGQRASRSVAVVAVRETCHSR